MIASNDYQQQLIHARKRRNAGDSDSEDETSRVISASSDIYKRRMNLKAVGNQ